MLLGYATTYIIARFWLLLITTCWLVLFDQLLDPDLADRLRDQLTQSIRNVSLVWLDIAVMAAVFLGSFVAYQARSWAGRRSGSREADYPRLIVPELVLYLPLLMSFVWAFVVFSCSCAGAECRIGICAWLSEGTTWILANAGWLLALGGIAIQFLHGGFKIANDIVNYFRNDVAHRSGRPWRAVASVYDVDPSGRDAFRGQLSRRLVTLVDDFHRRFGPFDRLDFVAHSLGSMVAIDTLRTSSRGLAETVAPIRLVTMGSPYRDVFHTYFPHMFPKLTQPQLVGVSRLINIYRANDYVGTAISHDSPFVEERPQPPLGHKGYFSDAGVVAEFSTPAPGGACGRRDRHVARGHQSVVTGQRLDLDQNLLALLVAECDQRPTAVVARSMTMSDFCCGEAVLEVVTRQSELMDRMAERLAGARPTPATGADAADWSEARLKCVDCASSGACGQWLAAYHAAGAEPAFCPNTAFFERCREVSVDR